jgi:hypothetical protein
MMRRRDAIGRAGAVDRTCLQVRNGLVSLRRRATAGL